MKNQTILTIEDDEDIFELVSYNLKKNGYKVLWANTGEKGIEMAKSEACDLILLDLMLPGIDGFQVCKALKECAITKGMPIIMLTAKGEDSDIVTGLELGADDYITKPFSPNVLLARIKSALRKSLTPVVNDKSKIKIESLVINPGKHEVFINDERIDLTSTEFKVLHLLAKQPGWAFSRYQIVGLIKGDDYSVTDRAVDVTIVGLRKKLGEYGGHIETVRGVGYRFKELCNV